MKEGFIDIQAHIESNQEAPSCHLSFLLNDHALRECLKTASHERLAKFLRQSSSPKIETHDRYITCHRLLVVPTCQGRLEAVRGRLGLHGLNVLAIKFVLPRWAGSIIVWYVISQLGKFHDNSCYSETCRCHLCQRRLSRQQQVLIYWRSGRRAVLNGPGHSLLGL